jgi:thiamine pyrophosphokinase
MPKPVRAVIFANGLLSAPPRLEPDDLLLAADGGARHLRRLGRWPDAVIGDFDSLSPAEVAELAAHDVPLIRFPQRKDFTDLELALQHAQDLGATEIIIAAATGERWDQTLANLLLPAAAAWGDLPIRVADGSQEIWVLHGGQTSAINGAPGDTFSLIPLSLEATGIVTAGLEYPLHHETLYLGSSRGVSNVLLTAHATVTLDAGLLLCVLIHGALPDAARPSAPFA